MQKRQWQLQHYKYHNHYPRHMQKQQNHKYWKK